MLDSLNEEKIRHLETLIKTFRTIKPLVAQKLGKCFSYLWEMFTNSNWDAIEHLLDQSIYFCKKVSIARRPFMSFRFKVRKTTE